VCVRCYYNSATYEIPFYRSRPLFDLSEIADHPDRNSTFLMSRKRIDRSDRVESRVVFKRPENMNERVHLGADGRCRQSLSSAS